jgi:hypothetical protein
MGCPRNSTKAQRINVSKATNHKYPRAVEDCAPGEARNSEKALEVNEENGSLMTDQVEWVESSEGVRCPSSNASSIICLDQGDEEDIGPQKPEHFNMFLTTNDNEMMANMWECLDSVPLETIRCY